MFYVIEGPNGAGKSTTAELIRSRRGCARVFHSPSEGFNVPKGGRAAPDDYLEDMKAEVAPFVTLSRKVGTHIIADRWTLSTAIYDALDDPSGEELWRRSVVWADTYSLLMPDRMELIIPPLPTCVDRVHRRDGWMTPSRAVDIARTWTLYRRVADWLTRGGPSVRRWVKCDFRVFSDSEENQGVRMW